MYIITIDAGTSNTRATLWKNDVPAGYAAEPVGCRDTAVTGSKEKLRNAVRKAIIEVIGRAGLDEGKIKAVVASGMITSNMGLCEIPHIGLPAGKGELAQAMTAVEIPGVWSEQVWFVPGLRQAGEGGGWDDFAEMDVIRGEETEIIALLDRLALAGKPAWLALPGSHSKYVYVNEKAQVASFITTLAGEMYAAIAGNTILANSVSVKNISGQASEDLFAGAKAAAEMGWGRACFVVRLAHLFGQKSEDARGDFLLGAVLASDIQLLKQKDGSLPDSKIPIIVAGRPELQTAVIALLQRESQFKDRIIKADGKTAADLAGYGALMLARERRII